jgi:hypothetical protein
MADRAPDKLGPQGLPYGPPPGVNPLPYGCGIDACASRPLSDRQALAGVLQEPTATPVVSLLRATGPSAVAGRVGAIVVDALNGHSGRSRSDIGRKAGEILPLVADRDPSAAVVIESGVSRIGATGADLDPDVISRITPSAMRGEALHSHLRAKASAGCDLSAAQMPTVHLREVPAIAAAQPPIYVWSQRRDFLNCDQAPKTLTSNVNLSAHGRRIAYNWKEC